MKHDIKGLDKVIRWIKEIRADDLSGNPAL